MTLLRVFRLGCLFALLAASAGLVFNVAELRSDLSFVVPRNPSPDVSLLAERLQRGPSAGLILVAIDGPPGEALAQASGDLAAALRRSGVFHLVANGQFDAHQRELAFLHAHRYLLNPAIEPGDFTVEALRAGLQSTLSTLATAYGPLAKRYLPTDPTGRFQQVVGYWAAGVGQRRSAGVWLSEDGRRAFLLLWSKGEGFDLDQQEATLALIRNAFTEVNTAGTLDLILSGPSVFAAAARQTIKQDMQDLSSLSIALVMALLFLAFRSPTVVAVLVLPLGFGVCAGALAVQFAFGEIHGIALAFGATLIGVVVDYPIHVVSHGGVAGASVPVWRTLRLGVLTTMAAFLPFSLSSFPGLGQIGLFAVVGLPVAALVTRFVLPSVLPRDPLPRPGPSWRWMVAASSGLSHLRIPLAFAAVVGVCLVWLRDQSFWESDLRNLSPAAAALRTLDRDLRREIGAADVRFLMVLRGESPEALLRRSEAMMPALDRLRDQDRLVGFDLLARYLPSSASQARRREALPAAPELRAALQEATQELPFRENLFEPFLEDVARAAAEPTLTLEDYRAAGLGWRVDPLIFRQGGTWVAMIVPTGVRDPADLAEFVAAQSRGDLALLDLKAGSEALVADYREEAFLWLGLGFLIAIGVLVCGQRPPARVLRVLLPVGLAVILTSCTLVLAGTLLSLFHLLSMLLVVGVGLDYALFFDRNTEDDESRARTLRANILCGATSFSVFAILATSEVPALRGIGVTVAVGTLFSLIAAVIYANRARV